jgi:hypothetical protein
LLETGADAAERVETAFRKGAPPFPARYTYSVLRSGCLVAAMVLAGVARAEPPRAQLVVIEDASGKPAGQPGALVRVPLEWHDGHAQAASPDGALQVTLALEQPEGAAAQLLTVEAAWQKRAWVHLVAIELELDGDRAQVIGRDLEAQPAGKLAFLERFDPKWIAVSKAGKPVMTAIVDDGLDDVRVASAPGHIEVRLDLDSAEARPFLHDAKCTSNWHAPNQHLQMPARLRLADEKVTARVQLVPEAISIVQARYPDGRRAALVVTDHADQTSLHTFGPLARGFIDHHLVLTKALFAHGAVGNTGRPQLEDPDVVKLADLLADAGSEIVPHSATPKPDARPVTEAALERFERWKTRTWIDHQPETNCEAFGDQGFHVGGKFGIADLLVAHRYQYVWAEDDAPPDRFDLSKPKQLAERAPTVWPIGRLDVGGPDSLWMFRTVWAFLEAKRFYGMYSAAALDRLERERGLHIAHTYLETYHARRTRFGMRNLFLPADAKHDQPGGKGAVKIDPRFDALLAALETRQARGSLWIPTLGALGDRLRASAEVSIRLAADGSVVVHTPAALDGATFVIGQPNVKPLVAGHAPKGLRADGKNTTFWEDLPEGDTTLTLTTEAGEPLPFATAPTPERAQR